MATTLVWTAADNTAPINVSAIDNGNNSQSVLVTLLKNSFLKNGEPSTVFMRFGQPAVSQDGYKSVTRPRLNPMKTTLSQAMIAYEGNTPDPHDNTITTIVAEPVQLGDWTMITDLLNMETLLPIISAQGEEMGNNAGRIIDEYIQSVLESDNTIWEILAGSAASREALTASDTMDFDLLLKAITFLTAQGQGGEKFKVIMHPNTFRDFCASSSTNTWLNKLIYEDYKWIKDGFVTSMENFDIYISANVKSFTVTPASPWTPFKVYPTYAFRSGAYGVSSLDTLEMIYKPYGSAGTADPLNQRATIWWKCAYGCAVLNPFFIVRMVSRSSTNYEWQTSI